MKHFLIVFVVVAWIGAFMAACSGQGVVAVSDVRTTATSGLGYDPTWAIGPQTSAELQASSDEDEAKAEPISTSTITPQTLYRIGVEGTFPPFATYDASTRRLTGFDIDLMKAVAAKAKLDVQYVNVGRNLLLSGVLNCEYDAGISAIAITDELRQQMAFSEPYLIVEQVIVVKKGNISITGRDALAGMTVGVLNGSPSGAAIQTMPDVQAVQYPTLDQTFKDLINGSIDASVVSRPRAVSYTSIPANKLKVVGGEFGRESYGIAICKDNMDLAKKINDGLAAVKSNGTLDRLAQKWLKNPVIK